MDGLDKAIEWFGGVSAMGRAIGASQSKISNWRGRGNIPAEYCPAIEKSSHGRITCESLRPDIDWAYLRRTCKRKAA